LKSNTSFYDFDFLYKEDRTKFIDLVKSKWNPLHTLNFTIIEDM